VQAKAQEMWERMLHSLSHRGISREAYLKITGRDETDLLAELAPEAEQSLRREAVIAAVVEAEQIVPSEQELLEAVAPTAEREGMEPPAVLDQLRNTGRLQDLTDDLAARQVVELIAAEAEPIAPELAEAREKLWTPQSEQNEQAAASDQAAARLWTPDR
jgi:trigger factor